MKYFDESEVEIENINKDFYICDEDESNKVFLSKEQAVELAKHILKQYE